MLDQGLEGFGVDVAHEGEYEVIGIFETIGIELKGLGIVHLVVVFGLHAFDKRVVVIHGKHEVVAESGVGIRFCVGNHSLGAGDIGLEGFLIAARRGEV